MLSDQDWIREGSGPVASFAVPGDGSCFFHSIALLTNYCDIRTCTDKTRRQNIGLELRRKIVDKSQWDRFGRVTGFSDLVPPLKQAQAQRYSAGDFLINFSARRLGLNLLILDDSPPNPHKVYLFPCRRQDKKRPYLCLRWLGKCHFEPIAQVSKDGAFDKDEVTDKFLRDRFPNANSAFIRGILNPETSRLVRELLNLRGAVERVDEIEV